MPDFDRMRSLNLLDLVSLHSTPAPEALFILAPDKTKSRWEVSDARSPLAPFSGLWATARDERIGDAPDEYHPKYLMAVLSVTKCDPEYSPIPSIEFRTDEWTRRSMTLNGMRMTTEYMTNGSMRILDLVRNRLAAHQSDVVHNVLIYLMSQILDARDAEAQERVLRSSSLAAFLGLPQSALDNFFLRTPLNVPELTRAIIENEVGVVARNLSIAPLVENQFRLLEPALRQRAQIEERLLKLIGEIVALLRSTPAAQ